jgi:hypothetical protein
MVLTDDQQAAVTALYPAAAMILVAGTGVGKTVIGLTGVKELIADGHAQKFIVAAPAKVVEKMIWVNEAAKWSHLRDLRIVQLEGTSAQRTKTLLSCEAEILLVSLNNLEWLLAQDHDCDGIIIDELSKASGKWTKGLKSKKKAGRLVTRWGFTATPVSQNFEKLYGMCRILDGGAALGTNKQNFMLEHFYPDYNGHNWTLKGFADVTIMSKVSHLVHLVADNKAETLPTLTERIIKFDMPTATRDVYNEMKRHMVAGEVEAANQAVKSSKLRQLASGFIYDDGITTEFDRARLHAAYKWVDSLDGRPGLIFYEFVEQEQLLRHLPSQIKLAQIQSMSHGVDGLQHEYADLCFMQPVWSRDSYEQAVGRVHRQGQMKPVTVTTLCCNNTLDELVMARVEDRGQWMELFKQHLKG